MRIFVNSKLKIDGLSTYDELIFEEGRSKMYLI